MGACRSRTNACCVPGTLTVTLPGGFSEHDMPIGLNWQGAMRRRSSARPWCSSMRRPGTGLIHCCNRSLTTIIRIISNRRRNRTFKRSVLDGIIITLSSAVSETTWPSEKRPSGLCARSGGVSDFGFTHFEKDRQKQRQPILISKAQIDRRRLTTCFTSISCESSRQADDRLRSFVQPRTPLN
jgi:hypothetical protein